MRDGPAVRCVAKPVGRVHIAALKVGHDSLDRSLILEHLALVVTQDDDLLLLHEHCVAVRNALEGALMVRAAAGKLLASLLLRHDLAPLQFLFWPESHSRSPIDHQIRDSVAVLVT